MNKETERLLKEMGSKLIQLAAHNQKLIDELEGLHENWSQLVEELENKDAK